MVEPPAPGPRAFTTTHWSLVVAARPGDADRTRTRKALQELCRAYWYPLYAFVRCRGYDADEAQDLTQAFFVRVLETDGLASANPARGRFRSFVLGAMKHFLANEWHRGRAIKRGGSATFVDLDALAPEARYALEPATGADPDAGFDREWAQESIDRALDRLRVETEARGKAKLFQALQGCLTGDVPDRKDTAARLGMSEGALKVAVHRLRKRYREILRAAIAETVADPDEVDSEMRYLVSVVRETSGTRL